MTDYYPETTARFQRETAKHEMTILHEDGLYRHLRFKSPTDSAYWFDLITVPNALIFRGDGESFVFSRLEDMFQFFRSALRKDGSIQIDPGYYAEKLTSDRASVMKYDEDRFAQTVKDWTVEAIRDGRAPRGMGRAVREDVLDNWEIGDESLARQLLNDFEFKGFRFHDAWEVSFRDFDWWFLWACYGICWGIRQYDQAKADRTEAYEGELAHLRSLLATLQRLDAEAGEHSLVRELLVDHYSDARIVDPQLTNSEAA